jgi:HAD superfamily hydrolase (TIGR01549 family)
MKIQCIVFDIDGTLIDNTQDIVGLFQDTIIKFMGPEKRLTTQEVLALWGPPGDEIFKQVFPPNIAEEAWEDFLKSYRINHSDKAFFSREQLERIKQKLRYLTIFTGKSKKTCEITLEKLGIKDLFDLILTGNDVPRSKPYPDALLLMIDKLHLPRDGVLFIGDSHLDVQAGAGAGINTAAALWGTMEPEKVLAQNPDYIFQTPEDFFDFVMGLSP